MTTPSSPSTPLLLITTLSIASCLALSGLCACDAAPEPGPKAKPAAADTKPDDIKAADTKSDDAGSTTGDASAGTNAGMPAGAETGETGAPVPTAEGETGGMLGDPMAADAPSDAVPPTKSDDIRDASHVPSGTPPASASAFSSLPVAKGDGAPIGGIGPGGIHLDDLVVGTDWEDSRCQTPQKSFSVASDERVSLCLRIVHEKREEPLTVSWEREGKSPKRASLNVKGIHAYRTRAWLPVKNYYKGKWRVRVLAADETVLGEGNFEITD